MRTPEVRDAKRGDDADLAARAEANLIAALTLWAGASEGGACEHDGTVFRARCAVPMRSFNNLLITGSPPGLQQVATGAAAYFAGIGGRYRLRVRDGVGPAGDAPFLAAGFERAGGIPSLAVALPVPSDGPPPLDIRAVDGPAALDDHVRVVASSFDQDPQQLSRVFMDGLLQRPAWRGYVGYLDGDPVGAAQLVVHHDVAGVYYVATLAGMRRRGIGEAMTRHALREGAALGCTVAALQASPMGLPIYERMGFRQVAYYRTYIPRDG